MIHTGWDTTPVASSNGESERNEKTNKPIQVMGSDGADFHLHSIARRVTLPTSLSFLSQFLSIQTYTLNNRTEMQRCIAFKIAVMRKCAKSQSQMNRTTLALKIGKCDTRGFSEFKAFILSSILL